MTDGKNWNWFLLPVSTLGSCKRAAGRAQTCWTSMQITSCRCQQSCAIRSWHIHVAWHFPLKSSHTSIPRNEAYSQVPSSIGISICWDLNLLSQTFENVGDKWHSSDSILLGKESKVLQIFFATVSSKNTILEFSAHCILCLFDSAASK